MVKREHLKAPEEQGDPQESDPEMTLLPGMPIARVWDKASGTNHFLEPTFHCPASSQG